MKVLPLQIQNINWTAEIDCSSCHTPLEIEPADVYSITTVGDQYTHTNYYCNCPVCEGKAPIAESVIKEIKGHIPDEKAWKKRQAYFNQTNNEPGTK